MTCDTPILEGESGVTTGYIRPGGATSVVSLHKECFVMDIAGSLAHLQYRCRCRGGAALDGPESGRTPREEALAVWEYLQRFQHPRWI